MKSPTRGGVAVPLPGGGGGGPVGVPGGGAATGQENYIKSLQQQIKILELEITYLKKLPAKEGG